MVMPKGFNHSEETKEKQSRHHRGTGLLGKHHSEETKRKIGISAKGRKHSKKTKKQIGYGKLGRKNYNWKGGIRIDKQGYICIYKPHHPYGRQRYVKEHRLLIEEQIGRYLLPFEPCHHRNGIKADNRLINLMAFISNSAHGRFEGGKKKVASFEILFDGQKLNSTNRCTFGLCF
jgi:hypothetical protein